MAGNIGKSLARTISERSYEYYVVEMSSFQLDDIKTFKPHISIITNITEDHLDRYNYNVVEYIESKLSITKKPNKRGLLHLLCRRSNNNKPFRRLTTYECHSIFMGTIVHRRSIQRSREHHFSRKKKNINHAI